MRLVVDTNVLVSGLLNPNGAPGRLVDAIVSGRLTMVVDDRILDEYRRVLARPAFGFDRRHVDALLAFVSAGGEHVTAPTSRIVLPDPTDLPFLEVAEHASADLLVTGNLRHFKPLDGVLHVKICTPALAVQRLPTPSWDRSRASGEGTSE